ncbi:MAG: autotransporter domain-containing protein, partial [Burkholderiales bacterium]|nr:autotransporter domain-containing protein [Burkholderiales bacterium]
MKSINLKRSALTAALVSAALMPAAHAAGSYSNVYVFGDSLSDVGALPNPILGPNGTNRWTYTINGQVQPLYVSLLAQKYGITLSPQNRSLGLLPNGGNDYAQGGSGANPGTPVFIAAQEGSPFAIQDVTTQVTNFLADKGGKADPNALYTMWIGGNDISVAMTKALLAGNTAAAQAQAQTDVGTAAAISAQQVLTLKAAGAQHIVVMNMPVMGSVPALYNGIIGGVSSHVATSATAGLVANGIAAQLTPLVNLTPAQSAALAGALQQAIAAANVSTAAIAGAGVNAARTQLNAVQTQKDPVATATANQLGLVAAGTSAEAAMAGAYVNGITPAIVNTLKAFGIVLPPAVLQPLGAGLQAQVALGLKGSVYGNYAQASTAANALATTVFDGTQSALLAKSGVVMIDVNKVMTEILADPFSYGVGNSIGYACGAGVGANVCGNTDASFDTSKQFLFADDTHPTPNTHSMFYQYVASVLDAPYFASQLGNDQKITLNAVQGVLDQRSTRARSVGAIDAIASVSSLKNDFDNGGTSLKSDGKNTALTVGADFQATAHTSLGVTFTQVKHDTTFDNSVGKFSSTDRAMTLFGRYELGPWTVASDASFGNARYDTIQRNVQLGAKQRVESASTDGNQAALRVVGSYGVSFGKVTVSPTVSLAYSETKVGGYRETSSDGSASTNMQFGLQRIDSLIAGIGAKAEVDMGRVTPFASAMYYNDGMSKHRTVSAGVVGESSSFDTDIEQPASSYGVLNLGARFGFSK